MNAKTIILCAVLASEGDWQETYDIIKDKNFNVVEDYEERVEKELQKNTYITLVDGSYPKSLQNMYKPPFAFKLEKGDLGDFVSMAGKYILVSNNQCEMLDIEPKNTIVVKGKVVYVGNDFVIKAFDNTQAIQIAVSLSDKVLINDDKKINKLIVNLSLVSNKDVYAIPTQNPSFRNNLIKEGVFLADSASDLMQ